MPLLDDLRAQKLIHLARTRFDPALSEAELKVLRDSASSADPAMPRNWPQRPPVRPAFVRWLATDPDAAKQIDPKGLRVWDVTLPGGLDLEGCRIAVTLDLRWCAVKGEISLKSAETRGVYVMESSVDGGFRADGIDVRGPLFLPGTTFSGEVRLSGARISANLECGGANLTVKAGNALLADLAEIGGNVFLNDGFVSSGTIRLPGARIGGQLNCYGAKLKIKSGSALLADGAKIGDGVYLSGGFEASGGIRLVGARTANLSFLDAKVARVDCRSLVLSGDLIWAGIRDPENASLDLTSARVRNLCDDRKSWHKQTGLILDGLIYEELTFHECPSGVLLKKWLEEGVRTKEEDLKVEQRIDWLKLQHPSRQLEPQPWMQLAKHLESKGDRKDAKHVIYKFRCLRAKQKWLIPRRWGIFFAWLEEAPIRILRPMTACVLLGTLIFVGASRSGAMIETVRILPSSVNKAVPDVHPPFQPFVYALENALPLVKLGMDDKWLPDHNHVAQPWFPRLPWLNWLRVFNSYWFLAISRWLLILSGWVQATILVVAVSDRFKK